MRTHSNGNVLGRSKVHCKIYKREAEYIALANSPEFDKNIENGIHGNKTLKILPSHEQHYTDIFKLHNFEVKQFFQEKSPESLHVGQLEDPEKWHKLGAFLNIDVPDNYTCHENKFKPKN